MAIHINNAKNCTFIDEQLNIGSVVYNGEPPKPQSDIDEAQTVDEVGEGSDNDEDNDKEKDIFENALPEYFDFVASPDIDERHRIARQIHADLEEVTARYTQQNKDISRSKTKILEAVFRDYFLGGRRQLKEMPSDDAFERLFAPVVGGFVRSSYQVFKRDHARDYGYVYNTKKALY